MWMTCSIRSWRGGGTIDSLNRGGGASARASAASWLVVNNSDSFWKKMELDLIYRGGYCVWWCIYRCRYGRNGAGMQVMPPAPGHFKGVDAETIPFGAEP
jgi:hypothetical protein